MKLTKAFTFATLAPIALVLAVFTLAGCNRGATTATVDKATATKEMEADSAHATRTTADEATPPATPSPQ